MKRYRFVLSAAAVAMAGLAVADTISFQEIRGTREFSGMMLVRPVQYDTLARRGITGDAARAVRQRAIARLGGQVVNRLEFMDTYTVRLPSGESESAYATRIFPTGDYEYVHPNWKYYPLAKRTPNDPRFGGQWGHRVMDSETGWTFGTGTSNVTIAVCDTGVTKSHEDFQGLLLPGYNSAEDKAEVDGADMSDPNGHGTHCIGDAAAIGNNGKGVAGVGWNMKVIPVKIVAGSSGGAFLDDMYQGANWAADNGARSISISFGGGQAPSTEAAAAAIAARGKILIFAGGNSREDYSFTPNPKLIVVAASAESNASPFGDVMSGFSAYGTQMDFVAPGQDILSTVNNGGYASYTGTSMAAPIVNGLVGLLWSINPSLTRTELLSIMGRTCDKIPSPVPYGPNGRINVGRAARDAYSSRANAKTHAPTSVTVKQGTFFSGDLGLIQTGSGGGYRIRSVSVVGMGHYVGAELNFKPAIVQGGLVSVGGQVDVSTNIQGATAMLYLWNRNTRVFDFVRAVSAPSVRTAIPFTIGTPYSKYLAADNSLKTMVRISSTNRRRGQAGIPFIGAVRFGKVSTTERS